MLTAIVVATLVNIGCAMTYGCSKHQQLLKSGSLRKLSTTTQRLLAWGLLILTQVLAISLMIERLGGVNAGLMSLGLVMFGWIAYTVLATHWPRRPVKIFFCLEGVLLLIIAMG